MARPGRTLIMVYNADSGILNGLKDAVHKVVSPSTYECSLCYLTYGPVSMKGRWKGFLDELNRTGIEVELLHRDEFRERYGVQDIEYPCILSPIRKGFKTVISSREMNGFSDLQELMEALRTRSN